MRNMLCQLLLVPCLLVQQSMAVTKLASPSLTISALPAPVPRATCLTLPKPSIADTSHLSIAGMNWLQVVQQRVSGSKTVLAGSKPLTLSVDVVSSRAGAELPSNAYLMLSMPGHCKKYPLLAAPKSATQAVAGTGLMHSYLADVPGEEVMPNLQYQVFIDYDYPKHQTLGARLARSGSMTVSENINEHLLLVPIQFDGQTGHVPELEKVADLVARMMPYSNLSVSVYDPLPVELLQPQTLPDSAGQYRLGLGELSNLLTKIDSLCMDLPMFNDDLPPRCIGLYPRNMDFSGKTKRPLGAAHYAGYSAVVPSFTETDNYSVTTPGPTSWLMPEARVFIHELGHLMSLGHADCGDPGNLDARLYPNASLGPNGGGLDPVRQFHFTGATARQMSDIMSYCSNVWMSDRGYRAVIAFKSMDARRKRSTGSKLVRFTWERHHWVARPMRHRVYLDEPLQALDGSYIDEAFSHLPMRIMRTELPMNKRGPFFLTLDDALHERMRRGELRDIKAMGF